MSREAHVRFCESRGVRFPPATHLVVLVSGTEAHAHAVREEVAAVLAPMGLRLSESKTRVCHIDEGFDFSGFRIQRRHKKGTNQRRLHLPVEEVPWDGDRQVRTLTRGSANPTLTVLLNRLNPVLRGWCNYFRHGVSSATFGYLDPYVWRRVIRWIRRRHAGITWAVLRRRHLIGWRPAEGGVSCSTLGRLRSRAIATGRPRSPRRG